MSAEGNFTRMDMYSPAHQHGGGTTTTTTAAAFTSRTQEKLELQQLNDRFAAYVQRVRQLAEKRNHVDSSTILKSTQAMEAEMFTLRDMYEQELEKLRKELENCNHERTTHQVQCNKHMQCASELQDRLQVEMDRSGKLHDEINNYQCRIGSLEAEIQNMRIAASRPSTELEQLQRNMANMTREIEIWKHRYEHEQVARQEAESKIQQLMQKAQFNEKVSRERMGELSSRIEMSTATILSLEAKVRDLSKADISVAELLKQVRDTAEGELKKYQIESEEQYNMNLTALKTQLDNEAKVKEDLEKERNQLRGSMGEQQARIRALEGQVSQLEHQRRAVEEVLVGERGRAADSMRQLEQKMREVQEMLVVKMREVSSAREQNIPLKAEIETLKALLEEEEKRLRLSVAIPSVMGSHGETTATGMSNYNNTASFVPTTTNSASNATASFNTISNTTSATTTTTTYNSTSSTSTIPPMQNTYASKHSSPPNFTSSSAHNMVSFVEDPNRHYVSSPLLSVTYTPEFLQSTGTSIDPMFTYPQYEDELDPQLFGYSGTLPLAKYMCENSPALNRVSVEPSPPNTPRPTGNSRAKSAPAERQRNLNLVRSDIGQGHDYFDKMFYDLQQDTLYSQGRPRSSQNERLSSSVYNDYAVSTSSSTGDLKIAEVQQDGKYIRLVNEGAQEMEFGGFMIQQNVGGHPVAVFRFPARSRFPPNSPITIYAGCNDLQQHQSPHDFVWKEQQKWGSGPECTTILCRPNGQAVAWTTAAHRFTRDAFQDSHKDMDRSENRAVTIMEEKSVEDLADDDSLADGNTNSNGNKTEQPVSLRREKQQPPTLQTSGAVYVHGNAQSRDPTCPDVVPAQKGSSSSQRKYVSGVSSYQHSGMRGTGKTAGIIQGLPSPFHSPLQQELQQLYNSSSSHYISSSGGGSSSGMGNTGDNTSTRHKCGGLAVRFTA